jgi:O-acetyl-ADP-ribose deacetylase (regulator of RNase III)
VLSKTKDDGFLFDRKKIGKDIKEQGIKLIGENKIQINSQQTIEIIHGDIKNEEVDAIVHKSNKNMLQFGSWLNATGKIVRDEARAYVKERGEIPVCGCGVTSAGKPDYPHQKGVKAKHHIIHVNPPFYREEVYEEREMLKNMMDNILD